jgi:hypothetical protein
MASGGALPLSPKDVTLQADSNAPQTAMAAPAKHARSACRRASLHNRSN